MPLKHIKDSIDFFYKHKKDRNSDLLFQNLTKCIHDKKTKALEDEKSQALFLIGKAIPTIARGIILFSKTKGFAQTVKSFIEQSTSQSAYGHLFEIEVAIQIEEQKDKTGECVQAFNQLYANPKTGTKKRARKREFDLVTNKRLIECKSGDPSKGHRKQFKAQKQIASQLAQQVSAFSDCTYHILMRKNPSTELAKWLDQQNIMHSSMGEV